MLKLHNSTAEVFVPDGKRVATALKRITHLGIGAHQDDLEFMALHGILAGFTRATKSFGGVTCTDGAGSARAGKFKSYSADRMMAVRRREQRQAARIGHYGVMIQLAYPSRALTNPPGADLQNDVQAILAATKPEVVYTHNPADKHETHVGVVVTALQALRELPRAQRPKSVIGCEVWRDLDWLADDAKVVMDVSGHDPLAAKLNRVFKSQIAGGKRYDLATLGRRAAHATFFQSHATDRASQLIFGMDLTPLVTDETRDIVDYVTGFVDQFRNEVRTKLTRQLQRTRASTTAPKRRQNTLPRR